MARTTKSQTALLPFRVVSEYSRLVVFRLGRMTGVKGPGVVGMLPIADRFIRVDLREFYLEIPRQTAITKDNAPISIDFITFFKVVDVEASVVQVADFSGAAQNIAATTLRSVVGDISLDDMLAKYGLDEARTALIGFSQGTLMSLHVGLRRATPLAGIVGFSGALAGPEVLKDEIRSRPPVLLVHGDSDEMLPAVLTQQAAEVLRQNDVKVAMHIIKGLGHGIEQKGLSYAARFLLETLKLPAPKWPP